MVADYAEAVHRARGGTLYVAEVGGLGWVAQGRLLRLLERGEVAAMGAAAPAERAAVRVVAGTRGELGTLVARGKFRKELFYRFEAFEIRLAALRTRPADIAALAHHFVAEAGAREGRRLSVSAGAVAELQRLGLAGNARELRTLMERAVLLAKGAEIDEETLEMALRHRTGRATVEEPWAGFSLQDEVRRYEGQYIERALKEAAGSVTVAARLLGLRHHQSLSSLISLKHPELVELRKPVKPRRRSIIKK